MNLSPIRITEGRKNIVRDCPGTKNYVCCGYKTIDITEGCVLSCSYCILRSYINSRTISIVNDPKMVTAQIDEMINGENDHVLRFGTGELSDSLALDGKYGLHRPIIEYFGEKRKALLELKSKWAYIKHLSSCLNPYTIISFSLSPQRFIDREEKRTSPVHKRLKTLRRAQEMGCFVGLHFDPVVMYDGFERDYHYLIDDVGRIVDLDRVIWVSIGLLRFTPKLYSMVLEEGGKGLLGGGEFITAEDGKLRYIKKERIRVYRMLYDMLKSRNPDLFIYFCMERSDVWEQVTGKKVPASETLIELFDERVRTFYGGML